MAEQQDNRDPAASGLAGETRRPRRQRAEEPLATAPADEGEGVASVDPDDEQDQVRCRVELDPGDGLLELDGDPLAEPSDAAGVDPFGDSACGGQDSLAGDDPSEHPHDVGAAVSEPAAEIDPAADAMLQDEELDRVVEALLFGSSVPLSPQKIASAAGGVSPRRVRAALDRLKAEYARERRAFDVLEIGGGYRLYSRPEFQEYVARLEKMRAKEKLSAAALETLAIVAYRQPIIRADIDAVRGVQSGPLLRSLMERKLIRVVGRSDQPGRPLLYGTTKRFLDHFGLASVKDLPRVEDLRAP